MKDLDLVKQFMENYAGCGFKITAFHLDRDYSREVGSLHLLTTYDPAKEFDAGYIEGYKEGKNDGYEAGIGVGGD